MNPVDRPLRPISTGITRLQWNRWSISIAKECELTAIRPGQIPAMCEAVGLRVMAIKRIRIGRVPLAKVPEGQWRYLQPWEKF